MCLMRKPIILLTVHRRYWELERAIANIQNHLSEFSEKPDIVVVWASPEIGRLWYFLELLKKEIINHVVYRQAADEDGKGCPTTHLASLNIRRGLNFIKKTYPSPFYVVCHDADIVVNPGIFGFVDKEMSNLDNHGVLFFWENGIRHANCWHTNFFAVSDNKLYWPPISEINSADVLEVQWGNYLDAKNLRSFTLTHNSRSQKFLHSHDSEKLDPFPFIPQKHDFGVPFFIKGYIPWYVRIKNFFKFLFWR